MHEAVHEGSWMPVQLSLPRTDVQGVPSMDLRLARMVLEGLLAMDRPIGRLMEVAKGLNAGDHKTALVGISGELLKSQFDLIEMITKEFPELKAEVDDT